MKYAIEKKYLTPNSKRRSGIKMPRVHFIVAHDTGNPSSTAVANVNYYEKSRNNISASAHTFIDDKQIIECIPATTGSPEKAWHVLYDKPLDNKLFGDDANDVAIGVELCYGGKVNNNEAYSKYVWYIAYLCYKFNLNPRKNIIGHNELDPERKTDPFKNSLKFMDISKAQFLNDVADELADCTTTPKPIPPKGDEDELKLEDQWQYDMLVDALNNLKAKGTFDDEKWITNAKNKTLTVSELLWLNTIILSRK
jgi:N-acetylmuramoyl-L-alanine amidase